MMANLRCILVDSKKHRAWPALNRLGIGLDNEVAAQIAGLYATCPDELQDGNFGTTCKTIEQRRGETHGDDSKLTPTERRFQLLLAAEKKDGELYDRVRRMVAMATSQGVAINYTQLETDLRFWGDRVKVEWATAFWAAKGGAVTEEAS
ncbi:MAG: hypothetical protein BWK76_12145 [Desulfobulbaceae bacterium A2]|nr:MAG: hypothetical protein BWK76_12145 [Desulfobulbaceae bacterium A2]